jgi:hypothetical protein
MRETRPCGFVRAVLGDRHPYRGSQLFQRLTGESRRVAYNLFGRLAHTGGREHHLSNTPFRFQLTPAD